MNPVVRQGLSGALDGLLDKIGADRSGLSSVEQIQRNRGKKITPTLTAWRHRTRVDAPR